MSVLTVLDPLTPEGMVSLAGEQLGDSVLALAPVILPVAATLLAIALGWRFARKFIHV